METCSDEAKTESYQNVQHHAHGVLLSIVTQSKRSERQTVRNVIQTKTQVSKNEGR